MKLFLLLFNIVTAIQIASTVDQLEGIQKIDEAL